MVKPSPPAGSGSIGAAMVVSTASSGSALRDGAAMLALAAESRPAPALVPDLVQLVSTERRQSTYTSTQEQAWMLLAARAVITGSDDVRLDVNGAATSWSPRP